MKSQKNLFERRSHPRFGAIAQLEDITYSILRKHGVNGPDFKSIAAKTIKD